MRKAISVVTSLLVFFFAAQVSRALEAPVHLLSPTGATATTNNTIWFDDALPTGALGFSDGGDWWNWLTANPNPFSGNFFPPIQRGRRVPSNDYFMYAATKTLTVNAGETLVAYVYVDPANVPSEIMLQWSDGSSWEHRAYWGASRFPWGTDGTASMRYMGTMPAAGQWVRLEVPASQVGLEGSTLSGMAFTLYDGRATWDAAGKAAVVLTNTAVALGTHQHASASCQRCHLRVDDALPAASYAQHLWWRFLGLG